MNDKANIELFDEVTARIFARLYESFPVVLEVNCIELTQTKEITDEGQASHETRICMAALQWLKDEDFIRLESFGRFEARGIVLTSKGLAALKSMPDSLDADISIGERLVVAVKAGAINTAVQVVRLVLAL